MHDRSERVVAMRRVVTIVGMRSGHSEIHVGRQFWPVRTRGQACLERFRVGAVEATRLLEMDLKPGSLIRGVVG